MVTVGPLSSVNERLVAIQIVRQVLLLRYSLRVRNLMVDAINKTEQPVSRIIRDALRTDAGLRDPAQVRQLDALVAQLNAIRAPAWESGRAQVETEFTALEKAEPEDEDDLFAFLLPGIELAATGVAIGFGIGALAAPFQGRTFRQWMDDAAADDAKRIRQAIYLGASAGESPNTIARRVVGSASAKGTDGTTQISRNHIDTIIRSGTVHVSAYARDQFYRANAAVRYVRPDGIAQTPVHALGAPEDPVTTEAKRQARDAADRAAGGVGVGGAAVFVWEQFIAILDNRTTKICRSLDGKRYKVGEGPIPPLHMRCRSNRVLVLPETLGGPVYDPGTYGNWIRRQPNVVKKLLMGTQDIREKDLADAAFHDYGSKPMTLNQVREEMRRILAYY